MTIGGFPTQSGAIIGQKLSSNVSYNRSTRNDSDQLGAARRLADRTSSRFDICSGLGGPPRGSGGHRQLSAHHHHHGGSASPGRDETRVCGETVVLVGLLGVGAQYWQHNEENRREVRACVGYLSSPQGQGITNIGATVHTPWTHGQSAEILAKKKSCREELAV